MIASTTTALPVRAVLVFTIRQDDDLWRIARDNLVTCGYPDVSTFGADIRAENPAVSDWQSLAEGSTVNLPVVTTG